MKQHLLLLTCLLMAAILLRAQQPVNEEKVKKAVVLQKKMMQNPGEMMAISAELQALKLNSAEDKEVRTRMMKTANEMMTQGKQQAIQMGGVSEQQVKNKMEEASRILPAKDMARINAVLKRTLKEGEIKSFCKVVHEAVKKKLDAKLINQAETFYSTLKAKSPAAAEMGNGAISCYLTNLTQQSVYIMGRVCSEETADANTLNNYAALLTNHGVEEGALPLLNYLNRKHPQDPVVLSNIAMAWLGLGDLKKAGQYADTCIRFFPAWAHQAHYVKSIEKESTGDRQGAAEELKKSAGQVFSAEKESVLRKWGGKLSSSHHQKHLPADALGLSKFVFPSLPVTYQAHINNSEEWKAYYSELDAEIKKLEEKGRLLSKAENENSMAVAAAMIKKAGNRSGYYFAAGNNTNLSWWNYFNEIEAEYAFKEEELRKELAELNLLSDSLTEEMYNTIKAKDTYECGEGQTCPEAEICNIHLSAYNTYMESINRKLEEFYGTYMHFKRKSINERVYAAKYCLDDIPYENYKNSRQSEFLRAMRSIGYKKPALTPMFGGFGPACLNTKLNPFAKKGLQRFEDIHCPPDWKLDIPGGSGVSTHCTKITLTLGFGIGSASYTEDLLTNEWTNMTLEIGKEIGSKDIIGKGEDVLVGANAGAAGYIEIDRQGITDWGVKGTAGLGNDAVGTQGEVKISLMSGKPSFSAKAEMNGAGKEITTGIFKN